MTTKNPKVQKIERARHLLDAADKVLGRLATQIAVLLMGKNKTAYAPFRDCGDFVVVTNAAKVKVTGKKETDKLYYHYSGYPGGLRTETLRELRERRPEYIIRHAVALMLPKNKLQKAYLKRLRVLAGGVDDS